MGFVSGLWNGAVSAVWPYLLAFYVASVLAAGLEGYHLAHQVDIGKQTTAIVKSNTAQHKAATTESAEHQKVVTQVQTKTIYLQHEVIKYVKDNRQCDAPVDVVRLLNAANR